jgi:hypothetical protein
MQWQHIELSTGVTGTMDGWMDGWIMERQNDTVIDISYADFVNVQMNRNYGTF